MSFSTNIGIFGGDKRQVYITEFLVKQGYNIFTYQIGELVKCEKYTELQSLNELFDKCSVLIGPIPLIKKSLSDKSINEYSVSNITGLLKKGHFLIGGVIPYDLTEYCTNNEIPYFDFMKSEKITILNAIATAEGAIIEAIQNSEINLHDSNCLVLGYGRCAKVLAKKLKGLDARVTVAARSEEALAYAETDGLKPVLLSEISESLATYNFIFNTIPCLILDKNCLELVKQDVLIIDIASSPGGTDFDYASKRNLNAKLCLGIPGKVAPKESAEILVKEISKILKERND